MHAVFQLTLKLVSFGYGSWCEVTGDRETSDDTKRGKLNSLIATLPRVCHFYVSVPVTSMRLAGLVVM